MSLKQRGWRVSMGCMTRDAESDDHTTFFQLGARNGDGDEPVTSRAAFQLHAAAIVNSVRDGSPGFISDDYLNAISAETTVTATELCMTGLWERDDERGGYIIHDPMVEDAVEFNAKMDRDKAFCDTTGGHEPSEEDPDYCGKCMATLRPLPPPPVE